MIGRGTNYFRHFAATASCLSLLVIPGDVRKPPTLIDNQDSINGLVKTSKETFNSLELEEKVLINLRNTLDATAVSKQVEGFKNAENEKCTFALNLGSALGRTDANGARQIELSFKEFDKITECLNTINARQPSGKKISEKDAIEIITLLFAPVYGHERWHCLQDIQFADKPQNKELRVIHNTLSIELAPEMVGTWIIHETGSRLAKLMKQYNFSLIDFKATNIGYEYEQLSRNNPYEWGIYRYAIARLKSYSTVVMQDFKDANQFQTTFEVTDRQTKSLQSEEKKLRQFRTQSDRDPRERLIETFSPNKQQGEDMSMTISYAPIMLTWTRDLDQIELYKKCASLQGRQEVSQLIQSLRSDALLVQNQYRLWCDKAGINNPK